MREELYALLYISGKNCMPFSIIEGKVVCPSLYLREELYALLYRKPMVAIHAKCPVYVQLNSPKEISHRREAISILHQYHLINELQHL